MVTHGHRIYDIAHTIRHFDFSNGLGGSYEGKLLLDSQQLNSFSLRIVNSMLEYGFSETFSPYGDFKTIPSLHGVSLKCSCLQDSYIYVVTVDKPREVVVIDGTSGFVIDESTVKVDEDILEVKVLDNRLVIKNENKIGVFEILQPSIH